MSQSACPYVSRGGLKLAAALDAFGLDVTGRVAADLGCNVGGFTDCLLQRGARHVFAVDTGYGALAWKLRQDQRVTVLERTNALHFDPAVPAALPVFAGCDLVVIDLGWTRQRYAIPAALRWLGPSAVGGSPRIVSLIKPHYEQDTATGKRTKAAPVLSEDQAQAVLTRVLGELPALGVRVLGHVPSPIRGGASRGIEGNTEYLALLAREAHAAPGPGAGA